MSKLDIAIVGEINLDLILYGLPEHMPTERELLASGFAVTLGSSSAILAHNLAALGSRVGFVTKVGDDSFGALAMERLRERGVDMAARRAWRKVRRNAYSSARTRAPHPHVSGHNLRVALRGSRPRLSGIGAPLPYVVAVSCSVNCCRMCPNFFGG